MLEGISVSGLFQTVGRKLMTLSAKFYLVVHSYHYIPVRTVYSTIAHTPASQAGSQPASQPARQPASQPYISQDSILLSILYQSLPLRRSQLAIFSSERTYNRTVLDNDDDDDDDDDDA